jgi:hypothetical protein
MEDVYNIICVILSVILITVLVSFLFSFRNQYDCINPITKQEFIDGCNHQDLCSLSPYSGSSCCLGDGTLSESQLEFFNIYHGGCENGTRNW